MATVRQRRPGVWEVRAFTGRDSQGRPTQVSRTVRGTKKEAQRVAAEMTIVPAARAGGRTVADLLDAWLELNQPTWAESTRRDQRSRATMVKADALASLKVARLGVADVERWHARLRRARVGEASIRNQHFVLRAALTQAVRWGWVSMNAAALSRLSQPRRSPRSSMSAADVRAVIAAARSFDPAAEIALRLAAVTGARRAELAALRWNDLDGDRLAIDGSIAVVRNGGLAAPELVDAPTKTANRRVVTLDQETVGLIERLAAERQPYGPWMFALDRQPPNPDRIGYWWRRARTEAGIDPSWRLHDMRHWSATVAIGGGHDVRTVAGRLGHANAAMTLKVYAHAVEAADENLARALGAELDEGGHR